MKHITLRGLGAVASAIFIAIAVCVCVCGCVDPMEKYKPVKNTTAEGEEKYDWPAADEKGFIEVPGGKVTYRLYGKGKPGTPLICLHGGPGGNYGVFYKQISLAEDRPVLLYNQLGSPDTEVDESYDTAEKVQSLYTLDRFVDELNAVIGFSEFKEYAFLCTS